MLFINAKFFNKGSLMTQFNIQKNVQRNTSPPDLLYNVALYTFLISFKNFFTNWVKKIIYVYDLFDPLKVDFELISCKRWV